MIKNKLNVCFQSCDEDKLEEESVSVEQEKSANDADNSQSLGDDLTVDEILKMKVSLTDGKESLIFSRGPKYSDALWPINCHLCQLGLFVKDADVISHVKSKKHKLMLSTAPLDPTSSIFVKPYCQLNGNKNSQLDTPIRIFPGEIITESMTHFFFFNFS